MKTPHQPPIRRLVEVDSRGRVSLARFGFKDTQLVVEELDDGVIVMRSAVVLTPAEARHYTDPDAVAGLDRAFSSARDGAAQTFKLRSQET